MIDEANQEVLKIKFEYEELKESFILTRARWNPSSFPIGDIKTHS